MYLHYMYMYELTLWLAFYKKTGPKRNLNGTNSYETGQKPGRNRAGCSTTISRFEEGVPQSKTASLYLAWVRLEIKVYCRYY